MVTRIGDQSANYASRGRPIKMVRTMCLPYKWKVVFFLSVFIRTQDLYTDIKRSSSAGRDKNRQLLFGSGHAACALSDAFNVARMRFVRPQVDKRGQQP